MIQLVKAIVTQMQEVGQGIVGKSNTGAVGPFYGKAPEQTYGDYACFTIISGKTIHGLGEDSYVEAPMIQLDTYASGSPSPLTRAIGNMETIIPLFNGQTFPMTGDTMLMMQQQGAIQPLKDPGTNENNDEVYHAVATFKTYIHRNF